MKTILTIMYYITKPLHGLNKQPILYKRDGLHLVKFGLFAAYDAIAIAFFTAYYLYIRGVTFPLISLVSLPIYIWLFSRLFHLLSLGKKFINNPYKYIKQTGFYVHGGVIGTFLWALNITILYEIPLKYLLDGFFWGAALGQFFGRLGCYNYGCCYGKLTSNHGIRYKNSNSKILRLHPELINKNVHPTQLYTALLNLIMFILICLMIQFRVKPGIITSTTLIYHGLIRVSIETIRGDIYFHNRRNTITLLSSSLIILLGVAILLISTINNSNYYSNELSMTGFILTTPTLLPTLVSILLIVFIGYGVHGGNLGEFPELFRKKRSYKGLKNERL